MYLMFVCQDNNAIQLFRAATKAAVPIFACFQSLLNICCEYSMSMTGNNGKFGFAKK